MYIAIVPTLSHGCLVFPTFWGLAATPRPRERASAGALMGLLISTQVLKVGIPEL